ncbi:hypothetical protein FRB98_000306 [Tulasnella sp. 332]|nr:hypothetical protein FRB98_000306 [Tulasnella sp. 332]
MSGVYSLFDALTNTSIKPTDIPPAIGLIIFLLNAVGHDACDATRNTQSFYQFVSRARDVCKSIKGLIDKVDNEGDFEAFERYIELIGPLEEELFRVAKLSCGDNIDPLKIPGSPINRPTPPATVPAGPKDVNEFSKPFNDWILERKELRCALGNVLTLTDPRAVSASEIAPVAKSDDLDWLSHLCESISMHKEVVGKDNKFSKAIQGVSEKFDQIQDSLRREVVFPEQGYVLATRSAMTLLAVIDMIETTNDKERRRRLRQPTQTWGRALKLLNGILEVTKATGPKPTELRDISTEWDAFEAYLLDPSFADLLPIVKELTPRVGHIRRHWHAQSFALVKLSIEIEKATREKPGRDIDKLDDALEAVTLALDNAAGEAEKTGLDQNDFGVLKTGPTALSFSDAAKKLSAAFKAHALPERAESVLEEAQNKDAAVLQKLSDDYTRLEASPCNFPSKSVKVIVKLCQGKADSKSAKTKNLGDLDHITAVDAIIWRLVPDVNVVEYQPCFFREVDKKFLPVTKCTKLSTLVDSGSTVTLYLVVNDLGKFQARQIL